MLSDHATPIAQAYGVGTPVSEMIMVARGEQGRIWRVDTDTGAFAIKELIICQTPADAVADVAYQEAVLASRAVPMPRDLSARWPAKSLLMLLGIRFGRTSGSISCRWRRGRPGRDWCDIGRDTSGTPCAPARPLIGWYTEPVGAPRWTQLLDEAKAADAPFVEALDAEITELLRLEALIEPPANLQSCHRDFWADNILSTPTDGLCVID